MKYGRRFHPGAYGSWASMIARCTNPNCPSWPNYGGRGISVCERWRSFENFLADMGDRPAGLTIERVNVDAPYEPWNCRWLPKADQSRNARSNRRITILGETRLRSDWARRAGISDSTLEYRVRMKWPEHFLLSPANHSRKRNLRVLSRVGLEVEK